MTERLLTTRDLAEHFDVKPGTVHDWVEGGKIPVDAITRLGGTARGRLRFRLSVVEAAWSDGTPSEEACWRPELVT